MSKKIICIVFVFLMLFSLASCEKNTEDININEEQETISPKEDTIEDSSSVTGKRFTLTLEQFNDKLNEGLAEMGDSENKFDIDNWQELEKELVDDNGVKYKSYFYNTQKITYTVAVENESNKLMNVGCGCSYEDFYSEKDDTAYSTLVTASFISAMVCGYSVDDMKFIYNLYKLSIKEKTPIFYKNAVYQYSENTKSGKDSSSVLFMVSAARETLKDVWELKNYDEVKNNLNN